MGNIFSLTLPFFGIIFIGFALAKILKIPETGLIWMNKFIIYVALPAMFFNLISKTPFDELSNWPFIIATTFSTFVIFAISFIYGLFNSKGQLDSAAIQGVAGAYGNIGYMAPGLALAAFGPAATVPAALIFSFDNVLHFTLVPLFVAISRGEGGQIFKLLLEVLQRILLHPFILATIAGVLGAYFQISPPIAIERILNSLGGAAAPCALFVMGVTVGLRPITRFSAEIPIFVFIKLIIHPLIVWFFLSLLGPFEPVWVYTAILVAALPQALNVFVLAHQYQVFVERASSIILVGTMVSVVTLTALLYIIKNNLLPLSLF